METAYFGVETDKRQQTEAETKVVLDRIDWKAIRKKLDEAVFDALENVQYHVEESVSNDASFNIEGRIADRSRRIVDALIRGDERIAGEVFGHEFQREARAKILEANRDLILHGALGDAKKEIERLQRANADLSRRVNGDW